MSRHPADLELLEKAEHFDIRKVDHAFLDDPYPVYRTLRENHPVHLTSDGLIFLTRHKDLVHVYQDHKSFSSDKKFEFGQKYGESHLLRHHTTSLVFNDPPLHVRVRRRIMPAFTPRSLSILEGRFGLLVEKLLDEAEDRGSMDVVTEFASALPVQIIGDMLGIPVAERGPLRDWSLAILGALEPVITKEAEDWGNNSVQEFSDYLKDHLGRFRAGKIDPELGEVLALLLENKDELASLSDEEMIQNCIFLLNAGHETTTNLIGNGIDCLLRFPDQREKLQRRPELLKSSIEEMLRFESSNQLGNRRATIDTEIGGVKVAAGSLVTLGIGAANRDPEVFDDPETFQVDRTPNKHLAFGSGIHTCAGLSLARIEGRLAIGGLIRRFPNFDKSNQAATRGGRARFRGYLSYPIELGQAAL
ncbi:cytochrome P450 [Alphaproteobacteria bacterium]|jgi:cytochrome P450|nr:cytochrome P450 [Alphaproteobacteria bacterium]